MENLQEIDSIDKMVIIELFRKNIKGKKIELGNYNSKHSGKEGHWLEKQMNLNHNSKNEPDINGYEMKKDSKKITFGDFSASEYLFSKIKQNINEKNKWSDDFVNITKDQFIKVFGTQKPLKHNRYSWSGKCVPVYNIWNDCGQKLCINEKNDICIFYSYSEDKRDYKTEFPDYLKKDNILIAFWKNEKMREHINRKFNNKGFFIIKKKEDTYDKICFGKKFDYDESFIQGIKKNVIIFDSGMHRGNNRNYSQFRSSNNKFWNELI